ncbi:hypothetical protein TNCV_2892861 [Trichonephila clavipes]|nr:hypothetical protein TNCV_2892861 [Trichonephila clavipes]
MSDKNFEQRRAIKLCFRLEYNKMETFAKLQQAYGDSVLSRAQEDPQFQNPLKMSLKSGILCVHIVA